MSAEVTIPARYNGPSASGNGGYSCGVLAAFITGPARVRLHVPPPLDTPLRVIETAAGGVEMYDGDTLVGSGSPASVDLDVLPAPLLEEAEAATGRYLCYEDHNFPTCFVCGPGRPGHDGLGLFPGPVSSWNLLACPWSPGADLLDDGGDIRPEIVWAALDCPGYFAAMGENIRPAVLGELDGELRAAVPGGHPLIVYSWPLGEYGRKLYAGTAIATAAGDILASSRSTWILLKQ
jgi:hypothetical protein